MTRQRPKRKAQYLTQKAIAIAERFMHIEASSGILLLFASVAALYLANSSYSAWYQELWHFKFGFTLNDHELIWDLHFWVNDILMSFFFLAVGMEIKQEIVFGALSKIRQALLPMIAAIGGVICPALIFFALNKNFNTIAGWAIPTATDIAFAVGILALLGKSIPHNVRIVLLSLAIIDDIIAILIITFVYSQNIDPSGLYLVGGAILLIILFQQMGIDFAPIYVLPGALLWFGLLKTGIHPSISGVILGLMTPASPMLAPKASLTIFENLLESLKNSYNKAETKDSSHHKVDTLKNVQITTRHMLPPSERVQHRLHPWVAFLIMPIFAFANAGVEFSQLSFDQDSFCAIFLGVFLGLVIGKPLGIFVSSLLAVKLKLCRLPENVTWKNILLIGILAGIGFTMAIFVTLLAFEEQDYINIAKISVLIASATAAMLGLIYGKATQKNKPSS